MTKEYRTGDVRFRIEHSKLAELRKRYPDGGITDVMHLLIDRELGKSLSGAIQAPISFLDDLKFIGLSGVVSDPSVGNFGNVLLQSELIVIRINNLLSFISAHNHLALLKRRIVHRKPTTLVLSIDPTDVPLEKGELLDISQDDRYALTKFSEYGLERFFESDQDGTPLKDGETVPFKILGVITHQPEYFIILTEKAAFVVPDRVHEEAGVGLTYIPSGSEYELHTRYAAELEGQIAYAYADYTPVLFNRSPVKLQAEYPLGGEQS